MKINEIIELLKADPNTTLESLGTESIEKVLDYLSDQYYNKNVSLISDQLFDLVKEYWEKETGSKYKIGAPIKTESAKTNKTNKTNKANKANKANKEKLDSVQKTKVVLPYWMGSLDKIKPSTNTFDKWIGDFTGPYVLSYKLDGVSALLCKKDGQIRFYTRGDGYEGQDISHCINMIGINVSKLVEGDAIRGELVISKENFTTIKDTMANARNAVSGIIGAKRPDTKLLKLVDFVAYWVLSPELKASEQLKYIEKKEFVPRSVEYWNKKTITMEMLSKLLVDGRKSHKYEIDGIVVIDDSKYYTLENGSNPSYGFAYKQLLTDQIAESVVVDVIWEVSKDKYIKPKIKIDTIELGGVEITFATANNAKFIVDNVIGPGAIVQIVRSGDVIPKIEKVIKPADLGKPKMPNIDYAWNETNVDIIATDLDADTMNKIIVKKLIFFFSTLGIMWMGEGMCEKFVSAGYDDLWKILLADKKDLEQIEGLGSTMIDKLYGSISNGLENRALAEIMCASQIFGRGIGVKKFKLITNAHPNILDIYKEKGSVHTTELINNIKGFDVKTTTKIVDNMNGFIKYLDKFLKIKPNLLSDDKTKSTKSTKSTNSTKSTKSDTSKSEKSSKTNLDEYAGKTIVFTGFRDKEIENELEKLGSKITGSVSKNTNVVIASNPGEDSNKIVRAKELQIKIMSKEEFYKSIGK